MNLPEKYLNSMKDMLKDDFDDYVAVENPKTGKRYALTLTCAANAAGYAKEGYAAGYVPPAAEAALFVLRRE